MPRVIRYPSVFLACGLVACTPPSTTQPTTQPASGSTSAQLPPAISALPPHVLAEAQGKSGRVRVEIRDHLRLLTIDGVVQGAVPTDPSVSPPGDPVAGLVRAFRPHAASALLIGLGTGRTAASLSQNGLSLDVVEIEPAVVAYAKQFFHYQGDAIVDDGLAFAERSERSYDVIVLDASLGETMADRLVSRDALRTYRSRLAPDGMLVIRLHASPTDSQPGEVLRRAPHRLAHVFGTGVAAEPQNLLLVSADTALSAQDLGGLNVWPLAIPGGHAPVPASQPSSHDGAPRDLSVLGYVTRAADGTLCLDLPHWEMGAVRYVLTGPHAETLGKQLSANARFPTQGDIGSDGDLVGSLHAVLGGGGVKRSDVRFSPLAASLRGKVRVRAVSHPDDGGGRRGPGQPHHPLLPYGGVLYDLEVESLDWTLDHSTWLRNQVTLRASLDRCVRAFTTGRLTDGVADLEGHRDALFVALGKPPVPVPVLQEASSLLGRVRHEVGPGPSGDLDTGAACDRIATKIPADGVDARWQSLREALLSCAMQRYGRVAQGKGDDARRAAGRILGLLETEDVKGNPDSIRKRFPDVTATADPLPPAAH